MHANWLFYYTAKPRQTTAKFRYYDQPLKPTKRVLYNELLLDTRSNQIENSYLSLKISEPVLILSGFNSSPLHISHDPIYFNLAASLTFVLVMLICQGLL